MPRQSEKKPNSNRESDLQRGFPYLYVLADQHLSAIPSASTRTAVSCTCEGAKGNKHDALFWMFQVCTTFRLRLGAPAPSVGWFRRKERRAKIHVYKYMKSMIQQQHLIFPFSSGSVFLYFCIFTQVQTTSVAEKQNHKSQNTGWLSLIRVGLALNTLSLRYG